MDPLQYLKEKRAKVETQVRNIKNFQVFDFNYVPAEPVERAEMDQIAQAILKYERSHIPTHILCFGSRGCGKTLSHKF
jgi:cell division control protein 6